MRKQGFPEACRSFGSKALLTHSRHLKLFADVGQTATPTPFLEMWAIQSTQKHAFRHSTACSLFVFSSLSFTLLFYYFLTHK